MRREADDGLTIALLADAAVEAVGVAGDSRTYCDEATAGRADLGLSFPGFARSAS